MATKSLAERILDAFPSGSYSLTALLRICDIVETDAVPTAAVECRVQPRLLVNPDFVAAHAQTPEKLLMLVMHELHHVLLGHTTLFPRMTPVQNFVFDAVINGIVCRMFPRADYTALFEELYSEDSFPACLLAPPPGWRTKKARRANAIKQLPKDHRKRAAAVHAALYSEAGASYHEVYELLPKMLEEFSKADPSKPGGDGKQLESLLLDVPLLGDHQHEELQAGSLEQSSPILFEVVRSVVEEWPQPPDPIRGRSLSATLEDRQVKPIRVRSNRAMLRQLIRKIANQEGYGSAPRVRTEKLEVPTPIPHLTRRSLVMRALGQPTLLHEGTIHYRRRSRSGQRVHVYLDVSGSMADVLKPLYGAILDCKELVVPVIHLFSTEIADITLNELRAGKCHSTFGTSIQCVTEHMQQHRVRNALLITDGFVGLPKGEIHDTLAKAKVGVAYLGSSICKTDLAQVARHTIELNPKPATK